MKINKNKKAYIVATVFGLSLIIIVPTVTFAEKIHQKHSGFMKSAMEIALFKPHMAENRAHFGIVSDISGSGFSLRTKSKNGTATFIVNTDVNTSFKKDGQSAAQSDLGIGQHVVIRGLTKTATNTVSAQSVNIITHKPTMTGLRHVFNKQK